MERLAVPAWHPLHLSGRGATGVLVQCPQLAERLEQWAFAGDVVDCVVAVEWETSDAALLEAEPPLGDLPAGARHAM
ncbi:hypothetical protein AK812_SmicGene42083 [Symbiodinium microadriaticum]|uniref:Uncharacterized protein n=1 Tax=Symbiodinium microadriaticum TaxID=2951 RepID=A0A1Q9C4H3_SYMMI|nr:hypothetical protein AK812_SmicGene42083 [Symbiodinium microadriaticum]